MRPRPVVSRSRVEGSGGGGGGFFRNGEGVENEGERGRRKLFS
jgi:hypothetical protein